MSDHLNINDLFWTVQGEGTNSGRRALFVRMPFCNLSCEWCDTSFGSFRKWTHREFTDFAAAETSRFAVVTGGEPMLNKHSPIVVDLLHELGFEVAVESNGTAPPNAGYDFVTVSPKRQTSLKGMPPYFVHPETHKVVDEFKYVVDKFFDFSVLGAHDIADGRRYSLSPEFGEIAENTHKILNYVKENPAWRISLQTHKWIGVP